MNTLSLDDIKEILLLGDVPVNVSDVNVDKIKSIGFDTTKNIILLRDYIKLSYVYNLHFESGSNNIIIDEKGYLNINQEQTHLNIEIDDMSTLIYYIIRYDKNGK